MASDDLEGVDGVELVPVVRVRQLAARHGSGVLKERYTELAVIILCPPSPMAIGSASDGVSTGGRWVTTWQAPVRRRLNA